MRYRGTSPQIKKTLDYLAKNDTQRSSLAQHMMKTYRERFAPKLHQDFRLKSPYHDVHLSDQLLNHLYKDTETAILNLVQENSLALITKIVRSSLYLQKADDGKKLFPKNLIATLTRQLLNALAEKLPEESVTQAYLVLGGKARKETETADDSDEDDALFSMNIPIAETEESVTGYKLSKAQHDACLAEYRALLNRIGDIEIFEFAKATSRFKMVSFTKIEFKQILFSPQLLTIPSSSRLIAQAGSTIVCSGASRRISLE